MPITPSTVSPKHFEGFEPLKSLEVLGKTSIDTQTISNSPTDPIDPSTLFEPNEHSHYGANARLKEGSDGET